MIEETLKGKTGDSNMSELASMIVSKFEEKYNHKAYLRISMWPILAYFSPVMQPADACPEASVVIKRSLLRRETVAKLRGNALYQPSTLYVTLADDGDRCLIEEVRRSYDGNLKIEIEDKN